MEPSVSVRKPVEAPLTGCAPAIGASAGARSDVELLMVLWARRYDRRTAGRSGAFIASPAHRQYVGYLRLQIRWNRRRFAHQGDGDAAIGGHEGVVGEQRIGVGLAANLVEIGCRKALLFEDLAHHVGAV